MYSFPERVSRNTGAHTFKLWYRERSRPRAQALITAIIIITEMPLELNHLELREKERHKEKEPEVSWFPSHSLIYSSTCPTKHSAWGNPIENMLIDWNTMLNDTLWLSTWWREGDEENLIEKILQFLHCLLQSAHSPFVHRDHQLCFSTEAVGTAVIES